MRVKRSERTRKTQSSLSQGISTRSRSLSDCERLWQSRLGDKVEVATHETAEREQCESAETRSQSLVS